MLWIIVRQYSHDADALETYGIKGAGEKFRGYCDLIEIYVQIVLIIKKTIYNVSGTKNLVAQNNLTFHYHFYCHFGKHVMNSIQSVNHIYWASRYKEPAILRVRRIQRKLLFMYLKSALQMLIILWQFETPTKLWIWLPPKGGW